MHATNTGNQETNNYIATRANHGINQAKTCVDTPCHLAMHAAEQTRKIDDKILYPYKLQILLHQLKTN